MTNPVESATTLRAGDKVLILLRNRADVRAAEQVHARLSTEFPGIEFVFMDDVAGALVRPADEPESVQFAADDTTVQVGFVLDDATSQFAADGERRVVSGMVIPWNQPAYSGGVHWMFKPGSLHWSSVSRVKMDRDHQPGTEFGVATALVSNELGLHGTFKVADTSAGKQALTLAQGGVYDGLSATVSFESEADGWTAHPENDAIRLVHSGTLRKVALTAMPAYDDARVAAVAARWAETPPAPQAVPTEPPAKPVAGTEQVAMTNPAAGLVAGLALPDPAQVQTQEPLAAQPAPAESMAATQAAFMAGVQPLLAEGVRAAVEAAFAALPVPQRQVIPAGQAAVVTREAPVYLMNGSGPSLVKDSWKGRTEGDFEAITRLRRFAEQTADASKRAMTFDGQVELAINTGNASQVIPPGYRPDLYVTQLLQGRPLTSAVSRGTIPDATPFNIPTFVSSANVTSDHVEGVNPTGGTLVLGTRTVAPGGISGVFELSREIVDSANPAVDAIALTAMHESYSQQTEAKVYAKLNGTNGQGGTITNGLVPSGAQVSTTTQTGAGMGGPELIAGIRAGLALYPFRRFARPNRGFLSQEGTSALSQATDTAGRPLLPWVAPQNAAGTPTEGGGYLLDGAIFEPSWSMTGNTSGDADALAFNSSDIWAWESPLLTFRFEERGGPARIDLALFGYFATEILRPVSIMAVRHTDS